MRPERSSRWLVASLCACTLGSACGDAPDDQKVVGMRFDGRAFAKSSLPPLQTDGQPLEAAQGSWTYTEFPDAACRDGSPIGIAVNRGASAKLMLYLEGGGACYDEQSCLVNPNNAEHFLAQLQGLIALSGQGVFDRDNPENPVRDWSFVYVPYCTGDEHSGANEAGFVPGVGPQKFVGHLNLKAFLKRIVPTFADVSDVLLTGVSAGGFGVTRNTMLVQRAFPNVRVKTIVDSGPPLSSDVYASCLQDRQRRLWKLEQTFLGECGAACPDPRDYVLDSAVFVAELLHDRPMGLIESTGDAVIRGFLGAGTDDCTDGLDFLDPGITKPAFRAALAGFRERFAALPNFGTFFIEGDAHTWIQTDSLYAGRAGNLRLVDWFARVVRGESPGHAGLD